VFVKIHSVPLVLTVKALNVIVTLWCPVY